jgi:hypothetical protein
MYFPYLYSKSSELLAVRAFAGKLGSPQKIVPVIEPVTTADGLIRLHTALKASGDFAYVIENPHLLDLKPAAALTLWVRQTATLFADRAVIRPTLKEVNGTTKADIVSFVARNVGRKIGLVVTSSRITPADIKAALGTSQCIVFMTNGADRVGLVGAVGAGNVVEVNNRFPMQRVNADYSGEEWFSRDHLDYAAMHGYPGFSDYTVLPETPVKGGGAPGAVAIHLTFKAPDSSLWIEHFVSDETDRTVGTAQSKLLEAIDHVEAAVTADPSKFAPSPALGEYRAMAASRNSTSLGKNKQLEVAHHLYTVARLLGI